jgi:hypothetical protein
MRKGTTAGPAHCFERAVGAVNYSARHVSRVALKDHPVHSASHHRICDTGIAANPGRSVPESALAFAHVKHVAICLVSRPFQMARAGLEPARDGL